MEAVPYDTLTDEQLLALCIWREARGETFDAKFAVGCSVRNRVLRPSWWGYDWHTVILKKWQYSSFNPGDPNEKKWPEDEDPSWKDSVACAQRTIEIAPDTTNGATNYYDTSIHFPSGWGPIGEWTNTLNIGRLKFWKHVTPEFSVEDLD
jgi:spore germination cell wall hydrolase CwlJ-like protein